MRNDLGKHQDVLEQLRCASEEGALSIIRQLKRSQNVNEAILSIHNGTRMPPRQPSAHLCARGILSPMDSAIEFELTILHELVYPHLEPLDLPELSITSLERNSRFQKSPKRSGKVLIDNDVYPCKSRITATIDPHQLIAGQPDPLRGMPSDRSPYVSGPLPPLKYCDPRLNHLDVQFWTKVAISNEFAASAISHFLETEHAIFGFFDADIFLSDFVDRRLTYCSPFLVSSLLCLACVCTSSIVDSSVR